MNLKVNAWNEGDCQNGTEIYEERCPKKAKER